MLRGWRRRISITGSEMGCLAQPSHRQLRRPSPTVSSSAADAEPQDPDSTNNLESEAPRDYFLKCKLTPGLARMLTWALPRVPGWALSAHGPGFLSPVQRVN